jgi:hypothetical protein
MRVLVACEYSGRVRDAFLRAGHDALSCDLEPTEVPGPHYQGDLRDLMGERWDLVVAHPPCTYLANSGVQWLHRDPDRWAAMLAGAAFFRLMFEFDSPRIAVENPIQHRYAIEAHGHGKPTQIVQPWQHGHTQSKATGLWLVGLPALVSTEDARAAMAALPARDRMPGWWTGSRAERWKVRSRTYEGIAQAMADQWGSP